MGPRCAGLTSLRDKNYRIIFACNAIKSNPAPCPNFQGSLGLDKTRGAEEGPTGAEPIAGTVEMVDQASTRVLPLPPATPPVLHLQRPGTGLEGEGACFFRRLFLPPSPLPPPSSPLTSHPPSNASALTSGQTHNRRDCFYSTN